MGSPEVALQPPTFPELFNPREGLGTYRVAGGVGKKAGYTVEDGFTVQGVGYGQEFLDRSGPGQSGKGFAIFGKTKAFSQVDPSRLFETEGSNAGLGKRAAETDSVPTCFLEDLFEFFRGQGKEKRMTLAGLFPGENFGWGSVEERDEFGEGCGKLMFQGDLADARGSGEGTWIRLPKDMEGHIFISRVGRMSMGVPIGRVTVQLDISGEDLAIES